MPITNSEIEERVLEACEWLKTQKKPYFSKAARIYGVHKDHVRRRFLEKTASLCDNGGHNKCLNDEEDRALCAYIDFADEIGLPIREKTFIVAANSILRKHYSNSPSASKMWASRWLSRHPEYNKKYRKPLAAIRKNIHDIEGLERWFSKLQTIREEYGIVDQDIHNMDETGFRIGVGRKHKVITRAGCKRQYLADPDNRDYVTSIESISTAGESHAPMLILKASIILFVRLNKCTELLVISGRLCDDRS
jgi:Tc5 transposase DNA-binding domain